MLVKSLCPDNVVILQEKNSTRSYSTEEIQHNPIKHMHIAYSTDDIFYRQTFDTLQIQQNNVNTHIF